MNHENHFEIIMELMAGATEAGYGDEGTVNLLNTAAILQANLAIIKLLEEMNENLNRVVSHLDNAEMNRN